MGVSATKAVGGRSYTAGMCPAAVDLIAVHDRAIDLAEGYIQVEKRLWESVRSGPIEQLRAIKDLRNEVRRGSPFRDRSQFDQHRLARAKLDGGEDEVHVRVARSTNPTKEIANRIQAEFHLGPADVDRLKSLHEKFVEHRKRFLSTHPVTTSLGAVALAGRLVPKEVFEVLKLESAYGWYQVAVTVITLYVLLAFGFAFGIVGGRLSARRQAEQVVDSVLIHLSLAVPAS